MIPKRQDKTAADTSLSGVSATVEADLVDRCRNGDGDAFERLLRPYRGRVLAYLVRSCGDRSQAEDLLQDVLMRAWKGLGGYRASGRLTGWLFSIAHSVVIDRARGRAARPQLVGVPELETAAGDDPATRLLAAELEDRLLKVVAELSEAQRQVFLLRQHGDLKFREIAELRGEPLSTVLGHMHYAMNKLRRTVREHYERAS